MKYSILSSLCAKQQENDERKHPEEMSQ